MENFGLGLILSFQDNASSGIERVMGMLEGLRSHIEEMNSSVDGSVNHLTAMSSSLGVIGALATGAGMAITSAFGGVIQKTMQMSSGFEQNITALTQLYGSADKAREKFLAFEQMSAATPLGMQAIQSAATRLKTVGIEAEKTFNVMVDGQKKMRPVLEILGDLAAIRPDKGLETVIREGIEFIEGNARPLKMSFGLDVRSKDSLGEALAGTAEERLDQLARMIEKAGYTGMLDKTNDQWSTIMQNLGDNFDLLMYYVSIGSGFFDEIKTPFKELFLLLRDIVGEQDDMKIIGGAIADGLRLVVAPALTVLSLLNKLVAMVAQFTKDHPKIVSMGIAIVGLGGQILTVAGAVALFTSLYAKFNASIMLGQKLIPFLVTGLKAMQAQLFALGRTILPVAIASAALYFAWRTNMFGIRTITQKTIGYVSDLLEVFSAALTHNDLEKGMFRLTQRQYNLAESMGVLPLLKALAKAQSYIYLFFEGFKLGIDEINNDIEYLSNRFKAFLDSFSGTPLESLADSARELGKYVKVYFGDETSDKVKSLGVSFAKLTFTVLSLFSAFKLFSMGKSLFGGVTTAVSTLTRLLGAGGESGGLIASIQKVGTSLTKLPAGFTNFANSSTLLNKVAIGFKGIGTQMQFASRYPNLFRMSLQEGLSNIPTLINQTMSGLRTTVQTRIASLGSIISKGFSSAFGGVWKVLSNFGNMFTSVLGGIGKGIWGFLASGGKNIGGIVKVFTTLKNLVTGGLLNGLFKIGGLVTRINPVGLAITVLTIAIGFLIEHWEKVKEVAEIVWEHITSTVQGVVDRLSPKFEKLKSVVNDFMDRFPVLRQIVETVVDVVTTIFGVLTGTITADSETASAILNTLGWAFDVVFDGICNVIEVGIGIITSVLTGLFEILGGVIDFIVGVFTGDWERAWEGVKNIFTGIFDTIKGVFDSVIGGISRGIDIILGKTSEAKAGAEALNSGESPESNALGGIYNNPILTWVAEAGYPEAIIPLDGSSRGVALWEEAGRRLGALPSSVGSITSSLSNTPAPSVPAPSPAPTSNTSNSGGITFEAGSIQFSVTTDNFDAEKAAKMIMPIIQRQAEIMRMTHREGGAFA